MDGSLRDANWYSLYFQRLREDFPSVRQAIIHVTAPREAVFARAAVSFKLFLKFLFDTSSHSIPTLFEQARGVSTGRIVPQAVLEAALEQVPKSVEILAPLVDYYAEINNPEKTPDVELVKPVGSSWDDFRKKWLQ